MTFDTIDIEIKSLLRFQGLAPGIIYARLPYARSTIRDRLLAMKARGEVREVPGHGTKRFRIKAWELA